MVITHQTGPVVGDFLVPTLMRNIILDQYTIYMTSTVVGSGRCFSVSGSLGSMTETPGMPASAAQCFGWVTEALWAWDSCQRERQVQSQVMVGKNP